MAPKPKPIAPNPPDLQPASNRTPRIIRGTVKLRDPANGAAAETQAHRDAIEAYRQKLIEKEALAKSNGSTDNNSTSADAPNNRPPDASDPPTSPPPSSIVIEDDEDEDESESIRLPERKRKY